VTRIRLENITKSFGPVPVIKGLDLTIEEGEFFTFVGPSGCGKSTLLNMIAGLEDVTSGRILFDNVAVNGLSPKDRDVAMVFQSYALYPHMTVFENIAFPLRMKKEKDAVIRAEARRVAALLSIDDLLNRKPKELSGGQRQRVALGRAIIRKPKVFLMDEPLSNLDARLRIEMRAELKKLHRELGITTVYVTHDQAEALGLSDRIGVLQEGRVQQTGTPQEVYRKPANVFAGGFIGSPPMNFIPCNTRSAQPLEIDCLGLLLRREIEQQPPGGKVVLGIRPEDVRVMTEKTENAVEVAVSVIENAGSFNWVDVVHEEVKIMGFAPQNEDLRLGGRAYLEFNVDRSLLFDAASGVRL
jgi:multiple sugar transport system ATP-binding protein